MRDQKNTLVWALGWWLFRRALRKRAGGAAGGGVLRKLGTAMIVVALGAGAFVAWRRFGSGGGDGGGEAPLSTRPDPAPHAPAVV